ncbi:unnamed protein product [Pseudo-nitzschia multistriata]|uniref:Uncharacterized protein n=1 Tax=Pseudo-nitzschia multistriata TaxID=183589 RepID=A0A448Z660_9STRA|nr:unnamed protein product [Pseudo-nitzschia multistriata]
MSVAPDRGNKRMKSDGGPMGSGPPDGYYGQHPPGRYPPYGGPGGPPPPMGSGYPPVWQQGHPPPHSWGSSGPPPPGPVYHGGAPSMGPDRGTYGGAYPPRGPPGMQGLPPQQQPTQRRGGAQGGPPPQSRQAKDGSGPPQDGSRPPQGYQGGYYPPPQGPHPGPHQGPPRSYGNTPYPPGGPPQMHHGPPPQSYGGAPPPSSRSGPSYGGAASRAPPAQPRQRPAQEVLGGGPGGGPGGYGLQASSATAATTGTDAPDFDNLFSPRQGGVGTQAGTTPDDDGNCSVATEGNNSKDKGRGSYKCGRCGAPKKGHVCPYQPKLTRKVGEPLPEMRSAAIQVEMDEFMTLRRLNLRIQGFPESYASEPFGEDMVVGEPHQPQSAMNAISPLPQHMSSQPQQHGGVGLNVVDRNGISQPLPPSSGIDPVTGARAEDPIVGTV